MNRFDPGFEWVRCSDASRSVDHRTAGRGNNVGSACVSAVNHSAGDAGDLDGCRRCVCRDELAERDVFAGVQVDCSRAGVDDRTVGHRQRSLICTATVGGRVQIRSHGYVSGRAGDVAVGCD